MLQYYLSRSIIYWIDLIADREEAGFLGTLIGKHTNYVTVIIFYFLTEQDARVDTEVS
jgi:hypothetical protein